MTVQSLVERHGKAELIAARVDVAAAPDLGRHVGRRADDGTFAGDVVGGRGGAVPGQTEVGDEHTTVVADEHVVGLEVTMNEAAIVRRSQPASCLGEHVEDVGNGRRLVEPVAKRRAVDELHGDEHAVVVGPDVEHRHHVGMRELGERPRLAQQPSLTLSSPMRPQDLQRHAPLELGVVGLVDQPHPAEPRTASYLVAAEHVPR